MTCNWTITLKCLNSGAYDPIGLALNALIIVLAIIVIVRAIQDLIVLYGRSRRLRAIQRALKDLRDEPDPQVVEKRIAVLNDQLMQLLHEYENDKP